MKITNELSLPEPLVRAISQDSYNAGKCDYSTTGLLQPPRMLALKRQHGAQLSEDAADRVFSLLGRSIHTILEKSAGERYIVEKRFFADFNGITISGQIDIYDTETATLQDWKLCSRWTSADGAKPEWTQQGNINALLMRRNGTEVRAIEYVALYRDWSKMQSARESQYPQRQVEVFKLPLWPAKQTEQFILDRIALHEAARVELPLCSAEERWQNPNRWALMRKGQKRAIKLYDTIDEAESAMTLPEHSVEPRVGEPKRCLFFCPVSAHCLQFREMAMEKL